MFWINQEDTTSPEDVSFQLESDTTRERGRSEIYELPEEKKNDDIPNGTEPTAPKMSFGDVIAQVRNAELQDEETALEDREYISKNMLHIDCGRVRLVWY